MMDLGFIGKYLLIISLMLKVYKCFGTGLIVSRLRVKLLLFS